MHIALIHNAVVPALTYGGTERVLWWLAKGLSQRGHTLTLMARRGSRFPYGGLIPYRFDMPAEKCFVGADCYHFFATPTWQPMSPYLVTIGGNGKAGERYFHNSVFVSRNHAERHHAKSFVYNGIDPQEYQYSESPGSALLFLAKASWKVKNVKGAIRIAQMCHQSLDIVGGSRWWLPSWRGTNWCGMLGGEAKSRKIAESRGLLFPVVWHEPFGLAVIEALMSGRPVVASHFGSLPELVPSEVGFLGTSYQELCEGVSLIEDHNPKKCREWAMQFHYTKMAESYALLYERVLSGETLNRSQPLTTTDQGAITELGSF